MPQRSAARGNRLFRRPPKEAAEKLKEWAGSGHGKKAIARRFGVSAETLTRWLTEVPGLQEAFDEGRETEHQALYTALFDAATKGKNVVAAIFLLKARHGYREGDQVDAGNRVNVTFNLPGALPLEAFAKVIEHDRADRTQPVPAALPAGPRRG